MLKMLCDFINYNQNICHRLILKLIKTIFQYMHNVFKNNSTRYIIRIYSYILDYNVTNKVD